MKAYLLARVSTDEQKDALSGQTFNLIKYAEKQKYDYQLFELIESAYKGDRNKFIQVVELIEQQSEKSIVVFDKVDRFSRDPSDQVVARLKALCKENRIELHFPSDNLIINDNSPATIKMILNVNLGLASYYSDASSDNIKRRQSQLRREGVWLHKAPFGYKNVTLDNGLKDVVRKPIESEAVIDIFTIYAEGTSSIREIRKYLISKYDLNLNLSRIARILLNPFYSGNMEVKGVIYPHKHVRLISQTLFYKTESIRKGAIVNKKRWAGLPFQFRGLIACGVCGCRISFENKKNKYIYGRCSQYKYKHGAKYVNEAQITEQLTKLFEQIRIPDEALEEVMLELKQSFANDNKNNANELRDINIEIAKYEQRLRKLDDEYFDSNISTDKYKEKTKEYRQTIDKLKTTASTFELDHESRLGDISNLLKLSNKAPELFLEADYQQKRSMVNMVLSNLTLNDSQLGSEYKKPFEMMALCNKTANWCWK